MKDGTMKSGIYSLLFALSFLYESGALLPVNALLGGSLSSVPSADLTENSIPEIPAVDGLPELPSMCLIKTLTSSSDLLLRTGILICLYDQGGGTTLNGDNFEVMYTALKDTLTCTLCVVDDVLKTGDTLKQLGTPTSELVKFLVEALRPIIDKAGLSPPIMKILCKLLLPALTPNCLPALVAEDLVKLLIDMKLQACTGQNEQVFYEDVAAVLKRLNCLLKSPGELPQIPEVTLPALPTVTLPTLPKEVTLPTLPKEVTLPTLPTKVTLPTLPKPAIEPLPVNIETPPLPPVEPVAVINPAPPLPPVEPVAVNNPAPPLNVVKRELGDALQKEGPKDPLVIVACTAVELLLKTVTPV
ncbi:uncharacterized protein ACMZJ9_003760 isoform 2-T2 [Mantella aurantiaca]